MLYISMTLLVMKDSMDFPPPWIPPILKCEKYEDEWLFSILVRGAFTEYWKVSQVPHVNALGPSAAPNVSASVTVGSL
jgi:hypothetical protein